MEDKPKNKVTIYWDNPSYNVVQAKDLDDLPEDIQKMIAQHILDNLNIGVKLR